MLALTTIDPVSLAIPSPQVVSIVNDSTSATPVTYTYSSSNSAVTATTVTASKVLKIVVQGYGEMDFLLMDTIAPNTIAHIKALADAGFYNGQIFHRVINDFMIQTGDPNGTDPQNASKAHGSGTTIAEEYSTDYVFSSSGILAMANTGAAHSSDSQYFVTSERTPWLNGGYTIFGKLIAGDSVRHSIEQVTTGANDKPTTDVIVTSVSIVDNVNDGLALLKASGNFTGDAVITVHGSDGSSKTFTVTMAQPTMDAITPSQSSVSQDSTTNYSIPLTGIYDSSRGANVALSVTSDNQALFSSLTVDTTPTDGKANLNFKAAATKSGTANVTVTVRDAGLDKAFNTADDLTLTKTCMIIVNATPTLAAIADPAAIQYNSGAQTINLSDITAGASESQLLKVTATSDKTGLIPNPTVTYTSPNATGSISYTPVADRAGKAHITVTVTDAGSDGTFGNSDDNTFSRTFTVVVSGKPDLDPITPATDKINRNSESIKTFLSGIVDASGGTNVQLSAVSDNPSLIVNPTVSPIASDNTAFLTYAPVASQSGTAHITVTVRDRGTDGTFGTADDLTTTRSFAVVVSATDSTLAAIPDLSLAIPSPVVVPLVNTSTGAVTYTYTSSDPKVTATTATTSKILTINVRGYGEMKFLLLDTIAPNTIAHIKALAESGFYNGQIFHRVMKDFMIQTGDPNGRDPLNESLPHGSDTNLTDNVTTTIAEEFNADFVFSAAGLLAMANTGYANTSDSQFFVTSTATPWLNGAYTIFGKLIAGDTVRHAIEQVATDSNAKPTTDIIVDSISITTDTHDGLILVKAAAGATGTSQIVVTGSDGSVRNFDVTINKPAVLDPVADVHMTTDGPTTIHVTGSDPEGDPLTYAYGNTSNSQLLYASISGQDVTVTPYLGITGVQWVEVGARDTNNSWTIQTVPVFIAPAAPLTVAFQPASGQSGTFTSLNNSTAEKKLTFLVTLPSLGNGSIVTLYDGNTVIGSAAVTGSSTLVTTDGTHLLADGVHTITAKQTLDYVATTVGDKSIPAGTLTSNASVSFQLTVSANGAGIVTLATTDGDVTIRRNGDSVEVVKNSNNQVLFSKSLVTLISLAVTGAANQSNTVTLDLSTGFTLPGNVTIQSGTGGGERLVIRGTTGTDTFSLGVGTVTANGLVTSLSNVAGLSIEGGAGDDTYKMATSSVPVSIKDTGGVNTLDFTGATAGITLDLSKSKGQAQTITPWGKTLSITGTITSVIGTSYADNLTGGSAAATVLRGMGGDDIIRGGSRNSVILGGDGNDTLYGGQKTSLIISGAGDNTLRGGKGQNILIAGTTTYDSNDAALLAIANCNSVRSLFAATRNGNTKYAQLRMGDTVQDSGAHNVLFGGAGQNWYLPGLHGVIRKR